MRNSSESRLFNLPFNRRANERWTKNVRQSAPLPAGDKYFVMTGYFEVQDLRTVVVKFEATGSNVFFVSMVLGEMVDGVYTEVDQGLAYENSYTTSLVNKEPGTRFPVRVEFTPSHASGGGGAYSRCTPPTTTAPQLKPPLTRLF